MKRGGVSDHAPKEQNGAEVATLFLRVPIASTDEGSKRRSLHTTAATVRDRSGTLPIEGSDLRSGNHRDTEDEERGNPTASAPSGDLPSGDAKNQSRLRRGEQFTMLAGEIKVSLQFGQIVSKGRSPAGIVGNQFGASSGDGHGGSDSMRERFGKLRETKPRRTGHPIAQSPESTRKRAGRRPP